MENIFREADLAYMEFCDEINYADTLNGLEDFMEDGSSSKPSLLKRIIAKLKALFNKVVSIIKSLFSGNSKIQKQAEIITKNEKLKNKKVKITDFKKRFSLAESYKKKIKAAKTTEEVEKLKKEYKTKRAAIIGTSAVAVVGLGALALHFLKGKGQEDIKKAEQVTKDAEKEVEEAENGSGKTFSREEQMLQQAEELERQTAERLAKWKEKKEAKEKAEEKEKSEKNAVKYKIASADQHKALASKLKISQAQANAEIAADELKDTEEGLKNKANILLKAISEKIEDDDTDKYGYKLDAASNIYDNQYTDVTQSYGKVSAEMRKSIDILMDKYDKLPEDDIGALEKTAKDIAQTTHKLNITERITNAMTDSNDKSSLARDQKVRTSRNAYEKAVRNVEAISNEITKVKDENINANGKKAKTKQLKRRLEYAVKSLEDAEEALGTAIGSAWSGKKKAYEKEYMKKEK